MLLSRIAKPTEIAGKLKAEPFWTQSMQLFSTKFAYLKGPSSSKRSPSRFGGTRAQAETVGKGRSKPSGPKKNFVKHKDRDRSPYGRWPKGDKTKGRVPGKGKFSPVKDEAAKSSYGRKWTGDRETSIGIKSNRSTRSQWQETDARKRNFQQNDFQPRIQRDNSNAPPPFQNKFNGAASPVFDMKEMGQNRSETQSSRFSDKNRDSKFGDRSRNSEFQSGTNRAPFSGRSFQRDGERRQERGPVESTNFQKPRTEFNGAVEQNSGNPTTNIRENFSERRNSSLKNERSDKFNGARTSLREDFEDSKTQRAYRPASPQQRGNNFSEDINPQSHNFGGQSQGPGQFSRPNFENNRCSSPTADRYSNTRGYQREELSHIKQIKDSWTGDALYGVNPVISAMKAKRRQFHKLYLLEGSADASSAFRRDSVLKIKALADKEGIEIEYLSRHDLNVLSDDAPHQGVVMECSSLSTSEMQSFPEIPTPKDLAGAKPPLWIALDEVKDPHNLGAILRTAYFLGVSGVVTCTRNSAPLSPAVSKVSAGALEHMTIWNAPRLQQTLAAARQKGWRVLGASASSKSIPCSTLELSEPTVVVVGNEGTGLRTTVKASCSELVQIFGFGGDVEPEVDSLNVSVAMGILMHRLLSTSKLATS